MALASKIFGKSSDKGVDLVWPANLVDSFDYLQIDIANFVPSATRNSSSTATAPTSTPVPTSSLVDIAFSTEVGSLLETTTTTTLKKENSILLPIPEDVSYADAPQWSDQAVGVLGKFGPGVAAAAMGGDSGDITSKITEMAGAGKVSVILKAIQEKLGADPNAITQNISGKIANPYLEQVFGGIGMREFSFSWKLVPRNEKEQKSIHAIIKTLRKSVLPNLSGSFSDQGDLTLGGGSTATEEFAQGAGDRWLEVPKVFNLAWKFQGQDIDSLPKIKTCVCKNVQVQYTPDNVWASHLTDNKPYPVAYNLALTFGEMEIITGKDVERGY